MLSTALAASENERIALIGLAGAAITTVLAPVVLVYVRRRLGSTSETDPETGGQRPRASVPDQIHESHSAIDARLGRLERGQEHTAEMMQRHMQDQALSTGHVLGRIDELGTTVEGLTRSVDKLHDALSAHLAAHFTKDRTP